MPRAARRGPDDNRRAAGGKLRHQCIAVLRRSEQLERAPSSAAEGRTQQVCEHLIAAVPVQVDPGCTCSGPVRSFPRHRPPPWCTRVMRAGWPPPSACRAWCRTSRSCHKGPVAPELRAGRFPIQRVASKARLMAWSWAARRSTTPRSPTRTTRSTTCCARTTRCPPSCSTPCGTWCASTAGRSGWLPPPDAVDLRRTPPRPSTCWTRSRTPTGSPAWSSTSRRSGLRCWRVCGRRPSSTPCAHAEGGGLRQPCCTRALVRSATLHGGWSAPVVPVLTTRYATAVWRTRLLQHVHDLRTPQEITLASLRVEHLFAADAATRTVIETHVR